MTFKYADNNSTRLMAARLTIHSGSEVPTVETVRNMLQTAMNVSQFDVTVGEIVLSPTRVSLPRPSGKKRKLPKPKAVIVISNNHLKAVVKTPKTKKSSTSKA